MPAHSDDTKKFPELTYSQQASSISAMLINIEAAINHHARHSPHGSVKAGTKCVSQVERLLTRLRATFPTTAPTGTQTPN